MTTALGQQILDWMAKNLNVGEWDYSWIEVADIAKALNLTKPVIKGALHQLVEDGLVYTYDWEGACENPNMISIHLTKQGWTNTGHPEAISG